MIEMDKADMQAAMHIMVIIMEITVIIIQSNKDLSVALLVIT